MISLLNDYRPMQTCDEMLDESLHVKKHWHAIYDALTQCSMDEMSAKQAEIDWHLEDNGVTYNVYNATDGNTNRHWSLDPIPFVLEQSEWDEIKKGIIVMRDMRRKMQYELPLDPEDMIRESLKLTNNFTVS